MVWMKFVPFFLIFLCVLPSAFAEVNIENYELTAEYGMAYHVLQGEQKSNNSKGRLTSPQFPYWNGSYTHRISQNWGLRLFGGLQFVRFEEPQGKAYLKSETKELTSYGLEILQKTGAFTKIGYFLMQQEHPLYFTKSPNEFEVVKKSFAQGGMSLTLGQRRRIGLLWGLGLRGFILFPTEGGDVTTEGGVGGEGFARLGWIGPLGTSYLIKGFYQASTAPNAVVTFQHEVFGYGAQINFTF